MDLLNTRAALEARAAFALLRSGFLSVESPGRMRLISDAAKAYGPIGATPQVAAMRHGDRPAIADDAGELSFAELYETVNRLSNALRTRGLEPGATVGILCRNHRWPLIIAFAASRAGLNMVWLNTSFSPRQAAEVAQREGVELLIHDSELAETAAGITPPLGAVQCSIEDPSHSELAAMVASGTSEAPPPPGRPGRIVQLTSGTTGLPKGAPRPEPRSLIVPGSLVARMPLRMREATVVAPPLFHGTGLLIALMTIGFGSKLVLRRRFDAATFLDDIATHEATAVAVVPIMLQRVLALGDEAILERQLRGQLRVVFCAGSALPAEVGLRIMDLLGDVVYNLYGSTEAAVATLATPADLRAAPTSVGKPTLGARVRILDAGGAELPTGQTGRIFVGSTMPFEGYTGGGNKEVLDGLMSTGDVGHLDSAGRLYVDGRDDEMIVSGGENVFPREVEELLVTHPTIVDAAAIGVDDAEFGKRLKAFVVPAEDATIDADEVKAFVRDNLARYKVPREVIVLGELPRNPTGKVLKRELATI